MKPDWLNELEGDVPWNLDGRVTYLIRSGSHAYGLNTPESDEDFRGIVVPPIDIHIGILGGFSQIERHAPHDITLFSLIKFIDLAANCNPNIIEMLWVEPDDILMLGVAGVTLRTKRDIFLSKKARYTFSGYAIAQLKRIKTHRKWLLNPPKEQPTRSGFGLPEKMLIQPDELGAMDKLIEEGNQGQIPDHMMTVYAKERSYSNAAREWQQYTHWKSARNPKRAAIEAQYGYDCKHAMHLVRLMRMCREILTDQGVITKRPDREELLAIRSGAWSYDQLIEWAEEQDKAMDGLYQASMLPREPDRVELNKLCVGLMRMYG